MGIAQEIGGLTYNCSRSGGFVTAEMGGWASILYLCFPMYYYVVGKTSKSVYNDVHAQ